MLSHEIHLADFQAFSCNSCGLCCTRPWNVRIEPEVEPAIRASDIHQKREREGYLPLEVLDNGKVNAHRQKNGHCMFLTEKIMCGLHSELGSQGKPIGCQLFPYRATRTPSGTYATLSFACPSVVAGLDRDVERNRAELATVLEKWPQAADSLDVAQLTEEQSLGWESYLELEAWLLKSYNSSSPLDSLLGMAASLSALSVGAAPWPLPEAPPLEQDLLRELLMSYLCAIISIIENEKDHGARGPYSDGLRAGERLPSCYFSGVAPTLDLDRTLPAWALQTFERYFHNQVLGKSILEPSVVSSLLSLAVGFALLSHYAEGFRLARGEQELNLASLTLAFEVVEGDAVSHCTALKVFYRDFESTLPKFFDV